MFPRSHLPLIYLLTAVYLGQSLFLGALHYHPASDAQCTQHVHHIHQHGEHLHAGKACSVAEHPSSPREPAIGWRQFRPGKLASAHDDCVICQYLSQGAVPEHSSAELATALVAPLLVAVQASFVSARPFSLPRPRSPPEIGSPHLG